jgi:hypothetical protein
VNAGGYVSPDDITVTRFRYLLETISAKTGDTHVAIADATAGAQTVLREKYGKEIKLLDLMEAANSAIPDSKSGTYKYIDIVSGVALMLAQ